MFDGAGFKPAGHAKIAIQANGKYGLAAGVYTVARDGNGIPFIGRQGLLAG